MIPFQIWILVKTMCDYCNLNNKKKSSAHRSQKQQLSFRSEGAKGNPVDEIFRHQKGKSEVWVYFGNKKVYKKHIGAII